MIPALALLVALLLQVTLVNRLPLPMGGAPDLVLLVVIACAVHRGAVAGTVIGFCGGLAVDVLPPVHHAAGQYALVLCLVGFLVGRAVERASAVVSATVAGAVGGPLLAAGVAAMIGTKGITMGGLLATLPAVLVYNLLAAPLVVWGLGRLLGRRKEKAEPLAGHVLRSRT